MTVQEIYDYNKRLNLPMLSGYTPEGDIDFWGVYRENFTYFDRLFYKTYRSFILFNSDGDTTGEVSTDFRNDCYAWLLANDKNYGAMALKYNCSYQQVRSWVMRYEKMGSAGLEDRRGKRAGTQPARTPEEEQRDRIAELERKIRDLQMENDLLKKVRELEMKDRYL